MTATLRVMLDQLVAPTDPDLETASRELTRGLIAGTPAGCDVEAIAPAGPAARPVQITGLAGVRRTALARRELAAALQLGVGIGHRRGDDPLADALRAAREARSRARERPDGGDDLGSRPVGRTRRVAEVRSRMAPGDAQARGQARRRRRRSHAFDGSPARRAREARRADPGHRRRGTSGFAVPIDEVGRRRAHGSARGVRAARRSRGTDRRTRARIRRGRPRRRRPSRRRDRRGRGRRARDRRSRRRCRHSRAQPARARRTRAARIARPCSAARWRSSRRRGVRRCPGGCSRRSHSECP